MTPFLSGGMEMLTKWGITWTLSDLFYKKHVFIP